MTRDWIAVLEALKTGVMQTASEQMNLIAERLWCMGHGGCQLKLAFPAAIHSNKSQPILVRPMFIAAMQCPAVVKTAIPRFEPQGCEMGPALLAPGLLMVQIAAFCATPIEELTRWGWWRPILER